MCQNGDIADGSTDKEPHKTAHDVPHLTKRRNLAHLDVLGIGILHHIFLCRCQEGFSCKVLSSHVTQVKRNETFIVSRDAIWRRRANLGSRMFLSVILKE